MGALKEKLAKAAAAHIKSKATPAPNFTPAQSDDPSSQESKSAKLQQLKGLVVVRSETPNNTTVSNENVEQKLLIQQTNPTDKSNRQIQQTDSSVKSDSQNRQANLSVTPDTQNSRPFQQTNPTLETNSHVNLLLGKTRRKTMGQKIINQYFKQLGSCLTSYQHISEETGLSMGTVRDNLRKLAVSGYIKKEKFYSQGIQGLKVTIIKDLSNFGIQHTYPTHLSNTPFQQTDSSVGYASKIDRLEKESIYPFEDLTPEKILALWPNVTKIGFGAEQIRNVWNLRKIKHTPLVLEQIVASLDRAEWELEEHGHLIDLKSKEEVKNPASYIFTALARWGVLRAHPEYKNRSEIELEMVMEEKKREEQAKHLLAIENENKKFEEWKGSLSKLEFEDIMRTCPGGGAGKPDVWLKKKWKENLR